jgi:hypothetical protein
MSSPGIRHSKSHFRARLSIGTSEGESGIGRRRKPGFHVHELSLPQMSAEMGDSWSVIDWVHSLVRIVTTHQHVDREHKEGSVDLTVPLRKNRRKNHCGKHDHDVTP